MIKVLMNSIKESKTSAESDLNDYSFLVILDDLEQRLVWELATIFEPETLNMVVRYLRDIQSRVLYLRGLRWLILRLQENLLYEYWGPKMYIK